MARGGSIRDECLNLERLDSAWLELADSSQSLGDISSDTHLATAELLDSENDISTPTTLSVPPSPQPFARTRRWQESTAPAFP